MPTAGLGTFGTLIYNDADLSSGASRIDVQVTPEYDEAHRTVVCTKNVLTVKTIIANELGTDSDLEQLRTKLSKAGQGLKFIDRGFGNDLIVNYGFPSMKDVRWGPFPELLSWKPVGADKACEIEFRVTTYLPPICTTNGLINQVGLMALNFGVDFTVNERGFTTRTISGYLEIAQTRNGRAVPDCADQYRHLMQPPQPLRFDRRSNYTTSPDKSRLDFTIVDKEIETRKPYPDGVVKISGQHSVGWSAANKQAAVFRNRFSMDIEMKRTMPRALAFKIFLDAVFSRINPQRRVTGVLIDSFDMSEDLYGTSASFSISYRVLRTLQNFDTCGLWTGFSGAASGDWYRWRASLSDVFGQRGIAGLGLLPSADLIIDLCEQRGIPFYDGSQPGLPEQTTQLPSFSNQIPPKDQSWLQYDQSVRTYRRDKSVRQSYLQTPPQTYDNPDPTRSENPSYPPSSGTSDVIQRGGNPEYGVNISGSAIRVGHPIPRPALISFGGMVPVEENCEFVTAPLNTCMQVPIFRANWSVDYYLPNSPGTLPIFKNLADGDGL